MTRSATSSWAGRLVCTGLDLEVAWLPLLMQQGASDKATDLFSLFDSALLLRAAT
jgi:hypothetical protein